jgi:hypothetical protein
MFEHMTQVITYLQMRRSAACAHAWLFNSAESGARHDRPAMRSLHQSDRDSQEGGLLWAIRHHDGLGALDEDQRGIADEGHTGGA